MKSPRLLITGINYAPEETGIAVQTTGLAEGLAGVGWDVTVITGIPHYPAWRPGWVPPTSPATLVKVERHRHYVPSKQSVTHRGAYEFSWVASSLPGILKAHSVDVILGVTPSLGGAVLAALASIRSQVPYVVMFQDLMGAAARQTGFENARSVARTVGSAEVFLARHASAVGVIAEGFRSYFHQRGISANRIHLVRNPVRISRPQRPRQEVRRGLGWAQDEFVVLHSGNMGLKQGLDNVLFAAARLGTGDRIRFVLQGDGNQRHHLEQIAKDLDVRNVTFAPLVPAEEVADVLAAADLLLLNQRREVRDMSLPGKLASYFAAGRPVLACVAADSEAAREVSISGGGVIVEPGEPETLVRAVRDLAADPVQRSKLGAAGRSFSERELSPEAALCQFQALLENGLALARGEARAAVQ